MRPPLVLDECACDPSLFRTLNDVGIETLRSTDLVGPGAPDDAVLAIGYPVLTFDCADFAALHGFNPHHGGIVLVYQDGDSRDMSDREIAYALLGVYRLHASLAGQIFVLNSFRTRRQR